MSIEVGNKVPGKVTGITNFGAFIDLGNGKTGLVHISEISDSFVKDIHDVLSVGDEVTVKVLTIGNDGKIGLSIRKAVDQPEGEAAASAPSSSARPSSSRPSSSSSARPSSSYQRSNDRGGSRGSSSGYQKSSRPSYAQKDRKEDFDTLMSSFLKDSDDRLTSLKRNTEGKRGGRGGRRN